MAKNADESVGPMKAPRSGLVVALGLALGAALWSLQPAAGDGITGLHLAVVNDFDVIVLDPPSFSNSKRMHTTFDVQRDHVALLRATLARGAAEWIVREPGAGREKASRGGGIPLPGPLCGPVEVQFLQQ